MADDVHRRLVLELRAMVAGGSLVPAIEMLRARTGVDPRVLYFAIMESVTVYGDNGAPWVEINMLRRLAMVVETVFPGQAPPLTPVPLKKFDPLNKNNNPDPPGGPVATAWGAFLSRVSELTIH
jgi:hypothetical protein